MALDLIGLRFLDDVGAPSSSARAAGRVGSLARKAGDLQVALALAVLLPFRHSAQDRRPWARSGRTPSSCTTPRGTRPSGWRSVGTYRTRGAPNDGSARANGDCSLRVLRGGSFADKAISVRSSARFRLRRGRSILRKRAFGWCETWIDGRRAAVERYVILGCGTRRAGEG